MKDEQEGNVQDASQEKTDDNFMVPMISSITRNNPEIREYIDHVEKGMPLRTIAKRDGVHASTVLRRIRKIEARRDDPLMDDVLTRISETPKKNYIKKEAFMNARKMKTAQSNEIKDHKDIMRVLRRLCEQNAFLVMAVDLPKAVVMRGTGNAQVRTSVLSRELGQKFLVNDWVVRTGGGKLNRYEVTHAGRATLKRMVHEYAETQKTHGFSETSSPFQEQHREWGERSVMQNGSERPQRVRVNMRESPINMLGRKKGKDGKPFLKNELLQAGERLREDFELAQLGPRVTQNWDRFLVGSDRGSFGSGEGGGLHMPIVGCVKR